MPTRKDYYVYMICDPGIKGSWVLYGKEYKIKPLYVGKGTALRWKQHLYKPKTAKNMTLVKRAIAKMRRRGFEPVVEFVKENLSEAEAFLVEERVITKLGRTSRGGILINVAPGGPWVPPRVKRSYRNKKVRM